MPARSKLSTAVSMPTATMDRQPSRPDTEPAPVIRVGLDAEALSGPEWYEPMSRLAICFGYGTEAALRYIEVVRRTPGIFRKKDLKAISAVVCAKGVVIIAHNANYDLDLLNGVLLDHDLPPLKSAGIKYQDTMNTFKRGMAFRNTLKARCAHEGIQLKGGAPDWRAVLQRKPEAWAEMRAYNENDVICTLQLERAYAAKGLNVPVKTWYPRKGGRP